MTVNTGSTRLFSAYSDPSENKSKRIFSIRWKMLIVSLLWVTHGRVPCRCRRMLYCYCSVVFINEEPYLEDHGNFFPILVSSVSAMEFGRLRKLSQQQYALRPTVCVLLCPVSMYRIQVELLCTCFALVSYKYCSICRSLFSYCTYFLSSWKKYGVSNWAVTICCCQFTRVDIKYFVSAVIDCFAHSS